MIIKCRDFEPKVHDSVFVADGAKIIGDVELGEGSSVWFNTVLRGDVYKIIIGKECNLQDGVIVHGTFNKCGAVLKDRVTVGHGAILHGCSIGTECLIGMGAIVMDNAVIGERSVVAAGALVTEGKEFEPESLIVGSPAKAVRKLTKEELGHLSQSADNYINYTKWYR
jgi:carbonic anhydrase/acetyltransferase-like protein (isoleucine patch superfamily)